MARRTAAGPEDARAALRVAAVGGGNRATGQTLGLGQREQRRRSDQAENQENTGEA
jgi:hypothetical protein